MPNVELMQIAVAVRSSQRDPDHKNGSATLFEKELI